MQVLDKGEIGLLNSMGTDETIASAAWVSYAKQAESHTDDDVSRLIRYLMKHKHGTPFEHVVFQFHVKAPIFVAREWFRHRIGSFNEVSGRYKTFEPEYYTPEQFRIKAKTNKQGSVIPEESPDQSNWTVVEDWNNNLIDLLTDGYERAYDTYTDLLAEGVANELARLIMPVGQYTEWWWTVNLRSLFNFMSLRSEETAQWEIRQYSYALEKIIEEIVPAAYKAWIDNGKVAP